MLWSKRDSDNLELLTKAVWKLAGNSEFPVKASTLETSNPIVSTLANREEIAEEESIEEIQEVERLLEQMKKEGNTQFFPEDGLPLKYLEE